MIELLLIAAVGLAFAGSMFGDDDGGGSDDDREPEDMPEEENGMMLDFDGSDTLTGTEGDDTLARGQDPLLAPTTVNLGGGNDAARVDDPFDIILNGEEGDDTLTGTWTPHALDGGEGNDELFGVTAMEMDGGGGNDTITLDADADVNTRTAQIDGGDGDDEIRVLADAGVDEPINSSLVSGGAGTDSFDVVYDLQSSQDDFTDNDAVLEGSRIEIEDFDPAAETLRIEVVPDAESADREVSEIGFEQAETDDGFTTDITLTFPATEDAFEAISTLTVHSQTAFGLDAIDFVGLNTA